MKTKLPNIFGGNEITLTASPHGKYQDYKSIDTAPSDLITPFDNCKTSSIQGTGGQRWFDINEVQLAENMRWVYDNYDKAKKMADQGVKDITENWTWKHTAGKLYNKFLEIESKINKKNVVKDDMSFMEDINA